MMGLSQPTQMHTSHSKCIYEFQKRSELKILFLVPNTEMEPEDMKRDKIMKKMSKKK